MLDEATSLVTPVTACSTLASICSQFGRPPASSLTASQLEGEGSTRDEDVAAAFFGRRWRRRSRGSQFRINTLSMVKWQTIYSFRPLSSQILLERARCVIRGEISHPVMYLRMRHPDWQLCVKNTSCHVASRCRSLNKLTVRCTERILHWYNRKRLFCILSGLQTLLIVSFEALHQKVEIYGPSLHSPIHCTLHCFELS